MRTVVQQICQDNTYAQQKKQDAEFVEGEAIMRRYADQQNQFNVWKEQRHR